ncbi:MAG: hypothetical protein HG453_002715 [Clostridiales bacterium]|nr:hypothetical protein [Clostridiales bacterium]
MCPCGSGKI